MTVQQRENVKRWWHAVITVSNFILLITFVWNQAKWQESVDKDMEMLKKHSENVDMHMPFQQKVEYFVPRNELQSHLTNISESLRDIKAEIKELRKRK